MLANALVSTRRAVLRGGAALLIAAGIAGPVLAEEPLKVGTSAGPLGEIADFAAKLAADRGLKVKIIEFSDWVTPNEALDKGDIDLNVFQNPHFLANAKKTRGYNIEAVAPAYLFTISLYSTKYESLKDVPDGSTVGIANDPVNAGRGLLLFQKAGFITLKGGPETEDTDASQITLREIVDNPKKLRFLQLDAAQLGRALPDFAVAQVSDAFLVQAGGNPDKPLLRDHSMKYAGQFVAKPERKNDPRIQQFIAAYRSPEVKEFIQTRYKGRVLTTW